MVASKLTLPVESLPSNDLPLAVISPEIEKLLWVCNFVADVALPLKFAVTVPVPEPAPE